MVYSYSGSCHCGSIRFQFKGEKISRGLRCNCSICRRKGAMMSPYAIAPQQITIIASEGKLGIYQFGLKTAKHYFCKECGIYPFHETARVPGHFRVNLGCVEGIDVFLLEADLFDGKHEL